MQSLLTLLDGIDKPLGGVEFLLYKLDGFFHLGCLVCLIAGIILKHFRILAVDAHIRDTPVVHAQDQFATHRFHYEIGNDLAQSCLHGTAPAAARFRIEGHYFTDGSFQGGFFDIQPSHDLIVMLAGELFKKIGQYPDCQLRFGRLFPAVQLE